MLEPCHGGWGGIETEMPSANGEWANTEANTSLGELANWRMANPIAFLKIQPSGFTFAYSPILRFADMTPKSPVRFTKSV
jgi:hypothetical protein